MGDLVCGQKIERCGAEALRKTRRGNQKPVLRIFFLSASAPQRSSLFDRPKQPSAPHDGACAISAPNGAAPANSGCSTCTLISGGKSVSSFCWNDPLIN
jgi:hypothetical protein